MIAHSDVRDLGIQSEMFCDAFVTMYEAGKITNARKTFDINKVHIPSALAQKKLMIFCMIIHGQLPVRLYHTNNPDFIAQNDKVVSINNIVEVDLYLRCALKHLDCARSLEQVDS
jgi:acyl-CoA hydrolase